MHANNGVPCAGWCRNQALVVETAVCELCDKISVFCKCAISYKKFDCFYVEKKPFLKRTVVLQVIVKDRCMNF